MSGPPPSFNPVFDIYHDQSAQMQDMAHRYGGFQTNPSGNYMDVMARYRSSYQGGYYQYQDQRGWPASFGAMGVSMFTGGTAMPYNNRTMNHNLDVMQNARVYSEARTALLQQATFDQMSQMMRNTSAQRGVYTGQSRADTLSGAIFSPYGGMAISMLSSFAPQQFEDMFGTPGSGIGMFGAAYRSATYRRNDDGSRWSAEQRAAYGSQAMTMMYWDPRTRGDRRVDSFRGGEMWSYLGSQGLLGRQNVSVWDQSQEDVISDVTRFMVDNNVYAGTPARTREIQERMQAGHAVNVQRDKIRGLLQQRDSNSLDPSERSALQVELFQSMEELNSLEKRIGLPGQSLGTPIGDMSGVGRAASNLLRHRADRAGQGSQAYSDMSARLEGELRDQIQASGLRVAGGGEMNISQMSMQDLSTMVDSITTAQRAQSGLANAEGMDDGVISRDEIRAALTAGQKDLATRNREIDRIETEDDRTDTEGVSARRRSIQNDVAAYRVYKRRGMDDAAEEHRLKAVETAGGGQAGLTIVHQETLRQNKSGIDINLNRPEDVAFGEEVVRHRRAADRGSYRRQMFDSLGRAGLEGSLEGIDTTEINLEGMISFQEAVMAFQDNPQLARAAQNAASIRSGESRLANYEKALSALMESVTDASGPVSRMMDMMQGLSGGALHQIDPTQMQHNIRRTFALAREIGQSEDFVMATAQGSAVMARSLGMNEQFGQWHTDVSIANRIAATRDPAFEGVWGARDANQVADRRNRNYMEWAASDSGNQFARALRIQETMGQTFVEGSSAANLMQALRDGRSTFEDVYVDENGVTRTRTRSTQMSETDHRRIIASGFGNEADFQAAAAMHSSLRSDRYGNQQILHQRRNEIMAAADSSQTSGFVSMVAGYSRGAVLRGRWAEGVGTELAGQGIDTRTSGRFMTEVSTAVMDRMLDSTEQEHIARRYGIQSDALDYHGQVSMRMQQEHLREILNSSDPGSEQYRMAESLLNALSNDRTFNVAASEANTAMNRAAVFRGATNSTDYFQQHDRVQSQSVEESLINAGMDAYVDQIYSNVRSNKTVARISDALGAGASISETLFAALDVYDMGEDSPIRQAMGDVSSTSDRLRELRLERSRVMNSRDIPEAEKRRRLAELDDQIATAEQNVTDAVAMVQPMWQDLMTKSPTNLSDTELARKIGIDLDTMQQYYGETIKDASGRQTRRNRLALKDDIRVDAIGRLQVRVDGKFQDKDDAVYFGQLSGVDEEGNPTHAYQQLRLNKAGSGWEYRDEKGKWVAYDHTKHKIGAGNAVYGSNKAGEVSQSKNLVWSPEGVLMRLLDDGSYGEVLDEQGFQITRESDQGNLISSGQIHHTNLDKIAEGSVDAATWYGMGQQGQGVASSRPSALSAEAIWDRRVKAAANIYTDSSSAVVDLSPQKVTVRAADGTEHTIDMILGSDSTGAQDEALQRYLSGRDEEEANITGYLNAGHGELGKYSMYATNKAMRDLRKQHQMMKAGIEKTEADISQLEALLAAETDPEKRKVLEQKIAAKRAGVTASRNAMQAGIKSVAGLNVRENMVKDEARAIKAAADAATSSSITTNPALLKAIQEVGGEAYQGRDTFTQKELDSVAAKMRGGTYDSLADLVTSESYRGRYRAASESERAKMDQSLRASIRDSLGASSSDMNGPIVVGPGAPVRRNDMSGLPPDPTRKGSPTAMPVASADSAAVSASAAGTGSTLLPPVQNCDLNAGVVNLTVNNMNLTNGSISITGKGDGAHAGSAETRQA